MLHLSLTCIPVLMGQFYHVVTSTKSVVKFGTATDLKEQGVSAGRGYFEEVNGYGRGHWKGGASQYY